MKFYTLRDGPAAGRNLKLEPGEPAGAELTSFEMTWPLEAEPGEVRTTLKYERVRGTDEFVCVEQGVSA
jgi:hypothetical protein